MCGRAGRKGTAYTFLDPSNEDAYAPILVKALRQAKRDVPPELAALLNVLEGQRAGDGVKSSIFDVSESAAS